MVFVNATKLKKEFLVENTRESKEAIALEKKLLIDLNTILEFIKENFDFKMFDYVNQLQQIKKLTFDQTYSIIRFYYQNAFEIGSKYVNELLVKYPYLTHTDLDFIEKQSTDYTARFYGRLENQLTASNEMFIKTLFSTKSYNIVSTDQEQIDFFADRIQKSSSYLYSSLAILIVTDGINSATIRKTKVLLNKRTGLLTAGAATNKILKEILEEELAEEQEQDTTRGFINPFAFFLNFGDEGTRGGDDGEDRPARNPKFKDVDLSKLVYEWRTRQDEKVCPICEDLDGTQYTIDDSAIPRVPDDSHFNCRCRLVVQSGSEIIIE